MSPISMFPTKPATTATGPAAATPAAGGNPPSPAAVTPPLPIIAIPLQCAQCGVMLSSSWTPANGRVYVHQTNANCAVTGKKFVVNGSTVVERNA